MKTEVNGRETMRFYATGDRGALFSDNGSIEVKTCALDELLIHRIR